jgi:CheY-like chemotaxis protein
MSEIAQKKILLVDDNELVKRVYLEKLREAGYLVETAADGEEGLAKMKSFVPDLILTDLFMPKITGFEMIEKIKLDPVFQAVPIIAFSDIRVDHEDLVKRGVKHFFVKGEAQPADINAAIEEILS